MTAIPSWARPGARVVYIGGSSAKSKEGPKGPMPIGNWQPAIGQVYQIRAVNDIPGFEIGIVLREYRHPDLWAGRWEPGWRLSCFRPLVEPKTEAEDVALFRHHLTAPHSSSTAPGHADAV